MEPAFFRFYGPLNDFLPSHQQQITFVHYFKERGSIKDMIEALGVPHTEIDLLLVNGESVNFSYLVQPNDRISVYPLFCGIDVASLTQVRPTLPEPICFVIDVHLGKLANYLRLLGFDVLYRNNYDDEELAAISQQEQRVLLTKDRGLLKRRAVTYGYCVRSQHSEEQVIEILQRFNLFDKVAPCTRCLRCNGRLRSVPKESITTQVPPLAQQAYNEFMQCQNCQQVYWQGAHYERLQELIDRAIAAN